MRAGRRGTGKGIERKPSRGRCQGLRVHANASLAVTTESESGAEQRDLPLLIRDRRDHVPIVVFSEFVLQL